MNESHGVHRADSEQEKPGVWGLSGHTCQLCGTVCDPSDGDALDWPLGLATPSEEAALLCGNCFGKYFDVSEDFLDAAVEQAVERLKEHRRTSPPYDETSEQALERDEHTCQVCGTEGYPKTERGLSAFPVEARNFHLRNLVTVCHECLKQDEERVRTEAAQAKKWINAEHEESEASKNDETGDESGY